MFSALLLLVAALAADPTEARRHDDGSVEPATPPPSSGFTFLGYAQARMALTDVVTTNPLLDGQIVGRLGGTNGTTTLRDRQAWFSEERVNGFFTYRPPIADSRLGLTAGFEVDFGFGDQSYNVGGNRGGGFGADQVNLQTRRLHVDIRALDKPRHTLDLRVGLQFVADGVRDPASARRDDLFRTGGGLRFWGSEATGLTAFGTVRDSSGVRLRYKAGAYTLWEFSSGDIDDVTLFMADLEWLPSWSTRLGLHAWYLADASDGNKGVLGTGPTSQLAELQGAARIRYVNSDGEALATDADVVWLGLDGGLNHDLGKGRLGLNGSVITNIGSMAAGGVRFPIRGVAASAELRYRWWRGKGSVIRLGADYASGDDPATPLFGGVLTGNSWGVVGALYGSHGAVLLFPDAQAINRQAAVVYDISAAGRGLVTGQLGLGWDAVPDRLNLSATAAVAADTFLRPWGTEINGRLEAEPFPFFTVSVTGAGVLGTDLPVAPWALLTDLSWVVF